MTKRIVSVILIICGILLVVSAFALTGYNLWDDQRAGNEAKVVFEELENLRANQDNSNQDNSNSDMFIPDYILNPKMDMPAAEIQDNRYIGTITIPALEIELPVMETWSYPQMQIAPCRYSGTAYLNNLIICAHNYASHFGRLGNLQKGDTVIFTDMDSNEFKYQVENIEALSGIAVEEMESGDWDLTLFTCTLDGQTRVTVRCNTVDD